AADPALYTLSLHDALPIYHQDEHEGDGCEAHQVAAHELDRGLLHVRRAGVEELLGALPRGQDIRDLPVDAEVEVLLVVQALEERSEEHTSELQSRFDLVCR